MSEALKIAICDDDENEVSRLTDMLSKALSNSGAYLVSTFSNMPAFMGSYTRAGVYDIVYMDIEVNSANGVDAMSVIREIDPNVIIIFVTSYSSYIHKAFRVGAFQYLQKPVQYDDFRYDLSRALKVLEARKCEYEFCCDGELINIKYNDICAVEILNKKIILHCTDKKYVEDGRVSIADKAGLFIKHHFVQCHKSYLVNMEHIKKFTRDSIVLKSGEDIPLGRMYKESSIVEFNRYIAMSRR